MASSPIRRDWSQPSSLVLILVLTEEAKTDSTEKLHTGREKPQRRRGREGKDLVQRGHGEPGVEEDRGEEQEAHGPPLAHNPRVQRERSLSILPSAPLRSVNYLGPL